MDQSIRFTDQQQAIISSPAKRLRVRAYAGTGKSSTLVGYAEERPNLKMLYLAYNAAIAAKARQTFPSNVECRTGHSLAFGKAQPYNDQKLGRDGQLGKGLGDVKTIEVARAMQMSPAQARVCLQSMNNFFYSADTEISVEHVKNSIDPKKLEETSEASLAILLSYTKELWARIQDPKDRVFKMPHDGYLKLFHLSNPALSKYDVILGDEMQDANPVITAIIRAQKQAGLVIVGDKHQSIYEFRGADDALDKFEVDADFVLSKSFRFGWGVGRIATLLLEKFKEETIPVEGLGRHRETIFEVDRTKPYAQICRTNALLLDIAVDLLSDKKKLHFVGGPEKYRFNLIMETYALWNGDLANVRDPSLKLFPNWTDFKLFAEETKDPEYKILISVVEKYADRIPELVESVKAAHQPNEANAEVVLTTAHRSKGLEWNQVVLSEDFCDLVGTDEDPSDQEINLIYVAVTRAEQCVELCSPIHDWLASIDEPTIKIQEYQKQALDAEKKAQAIAALSDDSDSNSPAMAA